MATRSVPAQPSGTAVEAGSRWSKLWQRIVQGRWGYIFVSSWVLLYAAFGIYPLVLSFYLTFFTYSFARPEDLTFVGFGNWIRGITDPLFWLSVFNIMYNQVIFITLKNGLGLAAALLLKQIIWGGRVFRTIYFIPVLTSVIVLVMIGQYIVSPTGPVQNLLLQLGLLDGPVFWQSRFWLAMPVIALINTWKWFGISTIILLAGLYAIDQTLYEAASLDGANAWQKFRSITLPQLMPQIFFLLVVDFINGLQMFGEVYALFGVSGGNYNQGLTPVLYLYAQAFDRSDMGYAATLGLLLAVLIGLITILQFRFIGREAE